jgi:REP element-mobilizing transposase RayT
MSAPDTGSTKPSNRRRHPAHGVRIESAAPTIVFLTAGTNNRMPWLASADVHALLRRAWTEASAWLVGRYMVMPDQVHLFATPGHKEIEFDNWVRYWKSLVSKAVGNKTYRWQTDHWDRRMRTASECAEKWDHVSANPLRHGLVKRSEDWPYHGVLNPLEW